jgi:hypothetical protein
MPDKKDKAAQGGKGKEKLPKTKPMKLAEDREFVEFVQKQRKPTPDDKGELPPEPGQDAKEPRESGTEQPEEAGQPT